MSIRIKPTLAMKYPVQNRVIKFIYTCTLYKLVIQNIPYHNKENIDKIEMIHQNFLYQNLIFLIASYIHVAYVAKAVVLSIFIRQIYLNANSSMFPSSKICVIWHYSYTTMYIANYIAYYVHIFQCHRAIYKDVL